jgi:hypothetical protein
MPQGSREKIELQRACWPILRSRSATRSDSVSRSAGRRGPFAFVPALRDRALGTGCGRSAQTDPRGRPGGRNASGPPRSYLSHQWYSSFGHTWNSVAKALTFSPAKIRRTAASLNSRLKTRAGEEPGVGPFTRELR